MRQGFARLSAVWLVVALAAPVMATGAVWNQVAFGTPLTEFLAAYPAAKAVFTDPGAARVLPVVSYTLTSQKFGPLSPCDLEFSFTGKDSVLYRIQARCAADAADVLRYLTSQYGNPLQASTNTVLWRRDDVEVSFQPKAGIFTLSDMERSKAVAASLMRLLGQVPLGPRPTSSGSDKSEESSKEPQQ